MKTLTDFIVEQLKKDNAMRHEYMRGIIQSLIDGDTRLVCLELRHLVNATMGFVKLGKMVDKNPKSLMRMLSGTVVPSSAHLGQILNALLAYDRLTLTVVPVAANTTAPKRPRAVKTRTAAARRTSVVKRKSPS